MKGIPLAARAVFCGMLIIGVTATTACNGRDPNNEARNVGGLRIPLVTTVGANTYRLAAVFVISGPQFYTTLTTQPDENVLSTTLPAGAYQATLQSFTLYKDIAGTFNPVSATAESNTAAFTVFADSTTTVNFQFDTDGTVVPLGSGNVDLTFGVTETPGPCTVLGPGCPDGFWCPPPALTGAPLACLPSGTTPIGAACKSPLECLAPATCHDFGAGPVCAALCTPGEFGQACASGGTCVQADPSYGLCTPEFICNPITVDPVARTVQSERFFLDFSNAVAGDPEDLDVLTWAGGPNLVQTYAPDACDAGLVEYFGNSWVPPDPGSGGRVLVGSGSTGSWEQDGDSIVIHSSSSGCTASTTVPVQTRYRFREGLGADTIEVERQFELGGGALSRPFRPFMPRLAAYPGGNVSGNPEAFDQVLHPNAAGTSLLTESVSGCPYGCQLSDWDGSWFAYYSSAGPFAGHGMIVQRAPSAIPANLWIDQDLGATTTNASSVLLLPPAGGFPSQLTERELLCFFDAGSWTAADRAALTLPPGCTLDLECHASPPVVGCDPNPCQHGGTCTPSAGGGHTCQCPSTITGEDCELVFTDIQVGQAFTCGLRNDGQVLCWGGGYGAAGVPAGTFQALSAGGLEACAIRTDGTIACWGFSDTGALNSPAGTFETIEAGGDYACATHDQVPTCWGAFDGYGSPPNDRFSMIEIGGQYSCGIRPDGTVGCWGHLLNDDGQANPPADTFRSLSLDTLESCGIRASDGLLECWGADVFGGAPLPSVALQAVDINQDFGCALDLDGHILCWGTNYPTPPPGSFKTLSTYGAHACAIGTGDTVTCWGQNGFDYGAPPY